MVKLAKPLPVNTRDAAETILGVLNSTTPSAEQLISTIKTAILPYIAVDPYMTGDRPIQKQIVHVFALAACQSLMRKQPEEFWKLAAGFNEVATELFAADRAATKSAIDGLQESGLFDKYVDLLIDPQHGPTIRAKCDLKAEL